MTIQKGIFYLVIVALASIAPGNSSGQCKSYTAVGGKRPFYELETECAKQYSESSYLSDGRYYRAILRGKETAEFPVIFYSGNTYRIASGTDIKGGAVIFSVYDSQENLLFSNKDHQNAPFWDIEFTSTIDCRIIIQLTDESIKIAKAENSSATTDKPEPDQVKTGADSTLNKPASSQADPAVCGVLVIGYKQEK